MGGRGSSSGMGDYKRFYDTPINDGMEYSGSGRDQYEFFDNNSNWNELIAGMSEEEREAFRNWSFGFFMSGRQYDGWDSMGDASKKDTAVYDKYLDQATLKSGVIVSRISDAQLVLGKGNMTATLEQLRAAEGSIVTSKGNMSFGAAATGLDIGTSSRIGYGEVKVEYRLAVPGGTKGAGMYIGNIRINGWGNRQREFMTNRDIAMRVGSSSYDSKRNVFVVNMEYVGREKHDYGKTGKI